MKEFIEKLIGMLEEKFKYNSNQAEIWRSGSDKDAYFREKKDLYLDRANTYGEVIRIFNQLAEEYRQDLDKNSQGWIPCSSGTMPNENETIMLTFKNSAGLHVGEATYKNKMFFYVTDTEFGYYEEVYKQPIAWKYKDAPYQPKGE